VSDARAKDAAPSAGAGMTALFRRTLTRVIIAQVVALLLLWLLQARYSV
jgi:hypothetical protein